MRISRRVPRIKIREKDVQRAILQYLALKNVWCHRMNSGAALFQSSEGKQRYVRFGAKGMADILVFTDSSVIWIEVKGSEGHQSSDQKEFQDKAESLNHVYILAHSVEDIVSLFERGK